MRTQFDLPHLTNNETFRVGASQLLCRADGWTEQTVSGHLLDFDPAARLIKLRPEGQRQSLSLRFNQIKRLSIEAPARAMSPEPYRSNDDGALQAFLVSLRDGAHFSGQCLGYQKTEHGLWIFFRSNDEHEAERVFLPKHAVLRFELGSASLSQFANTDFAQTLLHEWSETQPQALSVGVVTGVVETLADLERALKRQASLKPVPLGEALVGLGKITPSQLDEVLRQQQNDPNRMALGQLLIDKGLVSPSELQTAFARKMGYPFVNLVHFPVDVNALRCVPVALAQRLKVLPLVEFGRSLVVAMADPLQFKLIDEIEFSTQRKVVPVVSVSTELEEKIRSCYRELSQSDLAQAQTRPTGATNPPKPDTGSMLDAMQLAVELTDHDVEGVEEKPVEQSDNTLVRLVNSMIADAHQQGASDIHIEPYPGREKLAIRFRIDGQLRDYLRLPSSYRNALVARLKVMSSLDISERRKPQDGKIQFARFGGIPLELRVATVPTSHGLEDVVLRLLSSQKPLALEQLQLSPRNLQRFEALIDRPYGLFLCVGPTGSGKTTTLHSALRRINLPARKIWTAEDPVEITQAGLRQIQVNAKIGWTFAAALRTLLRADPDVIMVGEIRDHETAEIAIEASLTGHLVFSTLHTNSAAETVVRLIDLGVDSFSFADSLQGVLAQRLVRRVCRHCSAEHQLSPSETDELLHDYLAQWPSQSPQRNESGLLSDWLQRFGHEGRLSQRRAKGCVRCGQSGYSGRLALHELLTCGSEMRRLVQNRARPADILHVALNEGMRTLRQDGIEKVLQGLTSLTEVRSNTVN